MRWWSFRYMVTYTDRQKKRDQSLALPSSKNCGQQGCHVIIIQSQPSSALLSSVCKTWPTPGSDTSSAWLAGTGIILVLSRCQPQLAEGRDLITAILVTLFYLEWSEWGIINLVLKVALARPSSEDR